MSKLCASMFLRDDAAVLGRCLASLAGHVDALVAVDAGSADGSAEILREFLKRTGTPGFVVEAPFRTFAQVRNEALNACRRSDLAFDHILLVDPDMELVVEDPGFRDGLREASHALRVVAGVSVESRRIVQREAIAHFRGASHEFLEMNGPAPLLAGVHIRQLARGPEAVAEKLRLDVRLLRQSLLTEHDPLMRARYMFYLGNSHLALGEHAEARRCLLQRGRMGFWEEEVYCARLYAARAGEALGLPLDELLQEYAALTELMPWRAEALHAVARICRQNGWWEQARTTAEASVGLPKPPGALFLEDWVYDWGLIDELAIASFWTGAHAESVQLCEVLLDGGMLPPGEVGRVERNREMALQALERTALRA